MAGKIGLALGGGAALGPAHIGVLEAFEEKDLKISAISGTSIGSFIAALYAGGVSLKEMRKMASSMDWMDITELTLSRMGLLSINKLGKIIEDHLGNCSIEELDLPLAIIATNISSGEKFIFKEGPLSVAVTASSCVPGIFAPVEYNGNFYVDGGVLENVPISPLKAMGADVIVGVDLNTRSDYEEPDNIFEVIYNAIDILLANATQLQTKQLDMLIKPDASGFSLTRIERIDELIGRGYDAAQEAIPDIHKKLKAV